jgi:hypothetical protein
VQTLNKSTKSKEIGAVPPASRTTEAQVDSWNIVDLQREAAAAAAAAMNNPTGISAADASSAAAAAQLFSQPIRIIDDKNVGYLISSYQFAYKRIGITEDEVTGKISPQSEIVANRFYSAILPLVWQNNIKETLQKGEELYFFDIVVISSAGFRFYAPDLKITIL